MAISVTHTFVSPVVDDSDPNEVGPDEWNAAHTITGLGTAAEADSTDFATAAQGALADTAVQPAAIANMLETSDIGVSVQAHSAVLDATTASFLTAQETKLGHISVTQAVDLDAIETRVNALDAAVVLRGSWDASAGTFPGGGTAQAGDSYIVSVAGTVDSVAFVLNDRIIAIADNASTTTFAANWFKADYTDQVLSVAGKTGAVTLVAADLTDVTASAAELNYVDGVTSAIQTQLDAKIANSLLTTRGDIIRRGASAPERYALGTAGYALKSDGTDPVWAPSREALTGNRTYYVRTDGSDSNNGLADTSGGAFLTIGKAINALGTLDLATYAVTISIGSGTFVENIAIPKIVGGAAIALLIVGAGYASTTIGAGSGNAVENASGEKIAIGGFTIASGAVFSIAAANGGSTINISQGEVAFSGATARFIDCSQNAGVVVSSNLRMTGNAPRAMYARFGGVIQFESLTVYIPAALTFSSAFVDAQRFGLWVRNGTVTFDLTGGSATGVRYNASSEGLIDTFGSDDTFFPGSSPGRTATGGDYI